MTKKFTFLFSLLLLVSQVSSLKAQVFEVPSQYATVKLAVDAVKADASIVDGSEVTINVDADTIFDATLGDVSKAIKLTIQGRGADSTTLQGGNFRPGPGKGNLKRFFNLTNANNEGLEIIIKDIRFLNWGFGNTNGGGVFNILTKANIKISIVNCEFEGVAARAGGVLQALKDSSELVFDNCYFHGNLAFDNNSKAGLIHCVNPKKVSITNCTFMSNEQNVLNVGKTAKGTDRKLKMGIISIVCSTADMDVTISKNAFVNNFVADAGSVEFVQPTVSIFNNGSVDLNPNISLKMDSNIFIGNKREGETMI